MAIRTKVFLYTVAVAALVFTCVMIRLHRPNRATNVSSPLPAPPPAIVVPTVKAAEHAFYDGKTEYFVRHAHGEYTSKERAKRTRTLADGSVLLDDVNLTFYKVRRGDTLFAVRQRLGKLKEFEHVRDQLYKLDSFNIPARKLQRGMWLPLPLVHENRVLSDRQFLAYAFGAIRMMMVDPVYGETVKRIVAKTSPGEIAATMLAVAKQEAGGRPLGQFELHRWEPSQSAFSFSHFHVLMRGPGLRARRALGMTEGQTYHPWNSTRLFLAFVIEKAREGGKWPETFFPLDAPGNLDQFTVFYNGAYWRRTNPRYDDHIRTYLASARATLSTLLPPPPTPAATPRLAKDERPSRLCRAP